MAYNDRPCTPASAAPANPKASTGTDATHPRTPTVAQTPPPVAPAFANASKPPAEGGHQDPSFEFTFDATAYVANPGRLTLEFVLD